MDGVYNTYQIDGFLVDGVHGEAVDLHAGAGNPELAAARVVLGLGGAAEKESAGSGREVEKVEAAMDIRRARGEKATRGRA